MAHAPTSALLHTRQDSLIGFSYTPHQDLNFSAGDFSVSVPPLTNCFKITLKTYSVHFPEADVLMTSYVFILGEVLKAKFQ